MHCTIYVVKTKSLISCAVTAQLICAFVFAYTKSRFSHDKGQIILHFSVIQIINIDAIFSSKMVRQLEH